MPEINIGQGQVAAFIVDRTADISRAFGAVQQGHVAPLLGHVTDNGQIVQQDRQPGQRTKPIGNMAGVDATAWAEAIGGQQEAQATLSQDRSFLYQLAAWGSWLILPLGFLSPLVQVKSLCPD